MARAYTAKQVSRMVVDPYHNGNLFASFPYLLDLLPEDKPADAEKQLRYMAFVYDPASPMLKSHPDLAERRKAARKELGIFSDQEESLPIRLAFITRLIRNRTWTMICSFEAAFYEYNESLHTPVVCEDEGDRVQAIERKEKLRKGMTSIDADLEELYAKLMDFDEEAVEKVRVITSESIAKQLRK